MNKIMKNLKYVLEGAVVALIILSLMGGFVLIIKNVDAGLSKTAEQKKANQATYLQECLERTTDKDWCYRRIFNLNLEVKE